MTSDEIQDRINNPGKHGITKIHVLRDKRNQLPVNKQVGATSCASDPRRQDRTPIDSPDELCALIRDAVNAGKGAVMPCACAGDHGASAYSVGADGFAHRCL